MNRKKAVLTALHWKNSGVNDVEPKNTVNCVQREKTVLTALNQTIAGVNGVEPKNSGDKGVKPEKKRR